METKFKDFIYIRPDIETIKKSTELLLNDFNNAENGEIQFEILKKINEIFEFCFQNLNPFSINLNFFDKSF